MPLLSATGALILTGGLLGLTLAALRRRAAGPAPARLRRMEQLALSAHCTLHVVEWEGRRLLVGASRESIAVLGEREAGPVAAATPEPGAAPDTVTASRSLAALAAALRLGVLALAIATAPALLAAPAARPAEKARPAAPAAPRPAPAPLGLPMQTALMITGLTVLPAALMSLTPFLRITLVLHFLRQALGTQTAPSNPVLLGLGMFLTALIMAPVIHEIHEKAWVPYERGEVNLETAATTGAEPLRKFLIRYVREKDVELMLSISATPAPARAEDLDLKIVCPAYVLSELKTGFQIGAMLFLPFLIIDILVASVTLSIGIVQLPPVMVSAPFKILLFVLVDGWNLVVGSLVKSFAV